jgi:hypothetical protein
MRLEPIALFVVFAWGVLAVAGLAGAWPGMTLKVWSLVNVEGLR